MSAPFAGLSSPRVGVEHEFQVFDRSGQRDARQLLPTLAIDGARLDPGDAAALRCRWGGVITVDGREAEIATPPIRLDRGGCGRAVELADSGAGVLAAALPTGLTLRGYSTHLNVEVDDRVAVRAARIIVRHLAPAVMLLLDRRDSPGLLVRPRHRRMELGGEFQRGEPLLAALTMAAAVTALAAAAARRRSPRGGLPPALAIGEQRAPQRFGWYIDRRAAGDDLYTHGRAATLRTARGRSIRAQDVLGAVWAAARPHVDGQVASACLRAVDRVVDGASALPCELPFDPGDSLPRAAGVAAGGPCLLDTRRRGAVTVTAAAATWHAVTLRAEAAGATRWIRVPGEHVDEFVAALDEGRLDAWLEAQFPMKAGR